MILNYLVFLKGVNGNPGGIFKRKDRHCALWIDDPLRPGVNVGAGSFRMVHVQVKFGALFLSVGFLSLFSLFLYIWCTKTELDR